MPPAAAGVSIGFARFLLDSQTPWHGVAHQVRLRAAFPRRLPVLRTLCRPACGSQTTVSCKPSRVCSKPVAPSRLSLSPASAQALVGAYRILPCAGEALPAALDSWDEAKWAGLDKASQDNMDVLSLAW